jgi:predicted dinucleotide-binding enzyme
MRIGMIGCGRLGGSLAGLMVAAGHEVILSNSRGPETLVKEVSDLGARAVAGTRDQAAGESDLVVVAIPLRAYPEVPAKSLRGKIVIDTNNYYPDRDGAFPGLDDGKVTSSELLAEHLAGAFVVKAFNTIHFQDLATQGEPRGRASRRALPIAGDDAAAKQAVSTLIDAFGFDVVDAGALAEGRLFQPGTPAYNVRLTASELRAALAAR